MTEGSGSNQTDATAQEPAAAEAPRLDDNEAIDRTAEQAKSTATRSTTEPEGFPAPGETANLCFGPNIHDDLLTLLPLVGVWCSEGQANTIVDGEYNFGQQVIFSRDGKNYLKRESRIWKLNEEGKPTGPDQRETGFWRINDDGEIKLICVHSTGVTEIYYGKPVSKHAWELQAASTMITATSPASLDPGECLYDLMPNNDLGWVDKYLRNEEFTPHMSAQFECYVG